MVEVQQGQNRLQRRGESGVLGGEESAVAEAFDQGEDVGHGGD